MKINKQWALVQGLMVVCLACGFSSDVAIARNVGLGLIWFGVVLTILMLLLFREAAITERVTQKRGRQNSALITSALALVVLAILLWHGAWITAAAYLLARSINESFLAEVDKRIAAAAIPPNSQVLM